MADLSGNFENPYAPPEDSAAAEPAANQLESACKWLRGMAWAGSFYPASSALQLIDKTRRSDSLKLVIMQCLIVGLVAIYIVWISNRLRRDFNKTTNWLAGRPLSGAVYSFQYSRFLPSWRCRAWRHIVDLNQRLRPDRWRLAERTRSAVTVGPACRAGLRGLPRPATRRGATSASRPRRSSNALRQHSVISRVRFTSRRKSVPAERTY